MTRKVFKYPLTVADTQDVLLPAGAKVLTAQEQHGVVCLWALCEPSAPLVPRTINIHGTGHTVSDDAGDYVSSFQMLGGSLVFHVFVVPEEDLFSRDY